MNDWWCPDPHYSTHSTRVLQARLLAARIRSTYNTHCHCRMYQLTGNVTNRTQLIINFNKTIAHAIIIITIITIHVCSQPNSSTYITSQHILIILVNRPLEKCRQQARCTPHWTVLPPGEFDVMIPEALPAIVKVSSRLRVINQSTKWRRQALKCLCMRILNVNNF